MPPGRTRSAAACRSSSWSSGSGCERQRRSGRAASTPSPEHGASTSARSKPVSSGGSSRPSAQTTVTFVAPSRADVLLELAGARLVHLDGDDLAARASSPCRPARRRGRARARRRRTRPRARRAASRRSAARSGPRRTRSSSTRSTCQAPGTSGSGTPSISPRTSRTTVARRLVLRAHQRPRARPAPRSRHHVSATQSGYECASAASCQVESGSASTLRAPLVGEAAQDGVRERDRTLEPRPADELDRLVDGGVARARRRGRRAGTRRAAGPRAPARRAGRTGRRPDRLDRVVERACPLHGPVGELPRERAVAVVEAGGRGAQRPVRVGLVLEDASDDVERGRARGRDRGAITGARAARRRRPSACRRRAAPRPARTSPVSPTRARQTVTGRPCSSARAPMCGDSARTCRTSSSAGRSRSSIAVGGRDLVGVGDAVGGLRHERRRSAPRGRRRAAAPPPPPPARTPRPRRPPARSGTRSCAAIGPGVELLHGLVDRDARLGVTGQDRALDGCGAAPAGQQRRDGR